MLSLTEGQLITPAKVEDVPYVKAGQSVIRMDSETRNRRCTVAIHIIAARVERAPSIEQVTCVGQCFRVGIRCQEVQTTRKPLFERQQQTLVVAVPLGCLVAGIAP